MFFSLEYYAKYQDLRKRMRMSEKRGEKSN